MEVERECLVISWNNENMINMSKSHIKDFFYKFTKSLDSIIFEDIDLKKVNNVKESL